MTSAPPNAITRQVYAYYQLTDDVARRLWSTADACAIHYGFHDATHARTHGEALIHENRVLAELAGIGRGDEVLDAGCGVGGSSIWLAEHIGARATGISIAPRHIEHAMRNAERRGVSDRVTFRVADYAATGFADESFDVVWGCESFSHAADKNALLREAYRVLRPGGRIIIADGFQCRPARDASEQALYDQFIQGFGVFTTQFWDDYPSALEAARFTNVQRWEKSDAIRPAARRLWWMGVLSAPVAPVLRLLNLTMPQSANIAMWLGTWRTALAQWNALERGLWIYGVIRAEKPSTRAPRGR